MVIAAVPERGIAGQREPDLLVRLRRVTVTSEHRVRDDVN